MYTPVKIIALHDFPLFCIFYTKNRVKWNKSNHCVGLNFNTVHSSIQRTTVSLRKVDAKFTTYVSLVLSFLSQHAVVALGILSQTGSVSKYFISVLFCKVISYTYLSKVFTRVVDFKEEDCFSC